MILEYYWHQPTRLILKSLNSKSHSIREPFSSLSKSDVFMQSGPHAPFKAMLHDALGSHIQFLGAIIFLFSWMLPKSVSMAQLVRHQKYTHTQSLRSGECQTGLFLCLRSCNLIVSSSAPFLMHAEQGTRKLVDNWISGYGHIAPQKKHNKNQEFSACTAGRSS